MSLYLDANVLVALFTEDPHNARAEEIVVSDPLLYVSDFGAAELASAISRRVRMKDLTKIDAGGAFDKFDDWLDNDANLVEVASADVRRADVTLRRLDLNLRTPDAIHLAVAKRLGATLVTFDEKLERAARLLATRVIGLA